MLEHVGREHEVDACIGQGQVDAVIVVDGMIRHGGRWSARKIEGAYAAAPAGDSRGLEAAAAADLDDLCARRKPVADRFELVASDAIEQLRHRGQPASRTSRTGDTEGDASRGLVASTKAYGDNSSLAGSGTIFSWTPSKAVEN